MTTPMPPTSYTFAPSPGSYGLFLNDGSSPVIAASDYVLLHETIYNAADHANVWASNPVAVKNVAVADSTTLDSTGAKTSNVYGVEISVSNNTAEPALTLPGGTGAGYPQHNGQVVGLFVSYINTTNVGSSAISIGGIGNSAARGQNGWLHGIWIDGITTTGTGILFKGDVSGAGMKVGIDLSQVTGGYSAAALLLGAGHAIAGRTTSGSLMNIVQLDPTNQVLLGSAGAPLILRGSQFTVSTPTATIATAGTITPPIKVAGFLQAIIGGVSMRIPYYPGP